MKLLCVVPSYWPAFQFGGPIWSIHVLNKAMAQKGVDVNVYTTDVGLHRRVCVNSEVTVDGVKVTYFRFAKFFEFLGATGWQFSMPMTGALKNNLKLFDIIYIVSIWNYPSAIAAYCCRKYKKPYVISPRGHLYPYVTKKKFWKKWLYYNLIMKKNTEEAKAIHYTTEDEAEKCHSVLKLKNQAIVIPNGIDISEFSDLPDREKLRERYLVLKDKKVILFLGRINWKKGLDILIKAFSEIARERGDTRLLIVGTDNAGYIKQVRAWIRDYGIEDKVTFTGMLLGKEKLAAFSGSDVFVLPSYSENFGLSVVEAMACGLPVIISDRVGIHRQISEAHAGIVIKTNADQLAESLRTLLDRPDLCRQLGEQAKSLAMDEFNIDIVADRAIQMFTHLSDKSA